MASGVAHLLIYCLVVLAVTWAGGVLPLTRAWREAYLGLLTPFAAGVLLGAAFLHMLPEAAEANPHWTGPVVLGGMLFVLVFERVIATHYCEHSHDVCNHFQTIGLTFYVGLTLHSFFDGIVLGSGALIPSIGLIVVVAVAAHTLPAVFSLTSILSAGRFSRRRIVLFLAILSLATPTGAFAAFFGLRHLDPSLWRLAVGASAGTFLYIALADLLPTAERQSKNWGASILALSLGIAMMWGVGQLGGHHDDAPALGAAAVVAPWQHPAHVTRATRPTPSGLSRHEAPGDLTVGRHPAVLHRRDAAPALTVGGDGHL